MRGWTYRRAEINHGKRGWWRWWNTILDDVRRLPSPLFYVLQDDMRLCDRFFERSAELWASIADPQKASLYLHLTAERAQLGARCWTPVSARRSGSVVHSGWVDCAAFLCHPRLFNALGWRLHPIKDRRWHDDDTISSGVGQQISVRAQRAGLGLYRVDRSLVAHDGSPSLMSAKARQRWSMATVDFVDGAEAARARLHPRPHVFAFLATIPARKRALQRVVEALLPQVDRLGVYLNEYASVPRFLDREKIVVASSQESGVRGDAGKFFWAGETRGYQLVCDDDIAYPEDYVARLTAGIERHRRRAVVGFHGCVLREPVVDYHSSRRLLHFTRPLATDTPVHVLGTGVAGYHVSTIRVRLEDFPAPNMADVWLARLGQRQRVPFVCLQRAERWLEQLPGCVDGSLYAQARRRTVAAGPSPETLVVREHGRWDLQELPGDSPPLGRAPPRSRPRGGMRRASPEPTRPPRRPLVRVRIAGPRRGATLVLPESDHITDAVQRSGTYYERDLLDVIGSRATGGTFVDVGAHYGNHTTFFALECSADRVVSIEPHPSAYTGLLETVAENGLQDVVSTHRIAAHPEWRHVALTTLPWQPRHGSAVRSNSGRVGIAPASDPGDAPAAPLDEILDGVEEIRVVKVDVEGLSAQILASGRRLLRRDRPLIAAEAASTAERVALRLLLAPLGYREVGRYCWTATWLWEPAGVGP